MSNRRVILSALALATGISLVGCAGLPSGLSGFGANLSPTQGVAATSDVNDTVSALQAAADTSAAGGLTGGSQTMAIQDVSGGSSTSTGVYASPSPSPSESPEPYPSPDFVPPQMPSDELSDEASMSAIIGERHGRGFEERLSHLRGELHMGTSTKVTNPDGSITYTFTLTLDDPHGTETHTVSRTELNGQVTAFSDQMTKTDTNGHQLSVTRTRTRNADGSWTATFKEVVTRPDGKTMSISWARTENSDGSMTGSGSITRFDGTTVTLSFSRSAGSETETTAVDASASVEIKVASDDDSTQAQVQVVNEANGQVASTDTISDTTQVSVSDQ